MAVLRSERKLQPYDHEWVRPIPLWIRGAGAAAGPYRDLVETAVAILESTDPATCFDAMFAIEQLDELAFDPRAYDFDHPVNKRPNYLFGQWDMNKLDNAGRCRRFVAQQATLDAMLDRVVCHGRLSRKQVLFEEAAVLAGTILMGSGMSGNRPDAHDSTVTLASLVQKIAVYRDAFYEALLAKLTGPHGARLRAEAVMLRQAFGGARQHFNHFLAGRRAQQLQHVHVAQLFASIGYREAAAREAAVVPVASARMSCEMRCRLATAHLAVDRGQLQAAADQLPPVEDLLHRAIECGAMIDPWNILGFGGQYSLFPAVENSVHDHRVDDLLDMMSDIFTLYVRIHKAATAAGNDALQRTLTDSLAALAQWWDKFATVEVGSITALSGQATLESAERVAAALRAWHEGAPKPATWPSGGSTSNEFRSPKAYALVIETLLDRRDLVAAMALLVQWLSQADEIPLAEEDYSFHELAMMWMEDVWRESEPDGVQAAGESAGPRLPPQQRWPLARKFLDYLEANADEYWHVPRFEMAVEGSEDAEGEESQPLDEEDDLFGAAYEDVTYRDSTDDGTESELFEEGGDVTDFELVGEGERIVNRLYFLTTVAHLWKLCATAAAPGEIADRDAVLGGWLDQAVGNYRQLLELLASVHRHRIPPPRGTHESLVEYDQRRSVKETLLEEIIDACAETADAARMIRISMGNPPLTPGLEAWERQAEELLAALLRGDVAGARRGWPKLLRTLDKQPLLYVALGRGGNPQRIVASRGLQQMLRRLLMYLPRLGLLSETCQLLATAQRMETRHPVGAGGITEFDRIFEIGCKAVTHCLVVSSAAWHAAERPTARRRADGELVDCIEQAIEVLLRYWLMHSGGVRLSVLETVNSQEQWRHLKRFVERYGGDLFTQRFMSMGNLRGILHQGVKEYLQTLRDQPDSDEPFRLLGELDSAISLDEAAHWLEVAVEAAVENYGEYIDYNSITTQSDRGEMLYTLLDFLRLRVSYDRLAWNLRPVLLAHRVLVRCGRHQAAENWRQAVAERTATIADEHWERFERLCKKYGMRLPSVAETLSERFIRPLEIDRLCAWFVRRSTNCGAAARRRRCGNWSSRLPTSPAGPPARASSCRIGSKPWNGNWTRAAGKRARRRKRPWIPTCICRKSASPGRRSRSNCGKCWPTPKAGTGGTNSQQSARVEDQQQLERGGRHLLHPGEAGVERGIGRCRIIVAATCCRQP